MKNMLPPRVNLARDAYNARNHPAVPLHQVMGALAINLAQNRAPTRLEQQLDAEKEAALDRLERRGFPKVKLVAIPVLQQRGRFIHTKRAINVMMPCWRVYSTAGTPKNLTDGTEPVDAKEDDGNIETGRQSVLLLADGSFYTAFWDKGQAGAYGNDEHSNYVVEQHMDASGLADMLGVPLDDVMQRVRTLGR